MGPCPPGTPTSRAAPARIESASQWLTHSIASVMVSPAASRVASAEDREQPVPWVLVVSIRGVVMVVMRPSGYTTALLASFPSRCPPLAITMVFDFWANSAAWDRVSSNVRAGSGAPRSTASSGTLGVTMST